MCDPRMASQVGVYSQGANALFGAVNAVAGAENERAYPGDREAAWSAITTTGEGAYLLVLVALCLASQAICHWSVKTGTRIGGGHE